MVQELRKRIETGSYTVDPPSVAEAIIGRMRVAGGSAVLVPLKPPDGDTGAVKKRDAISGFDDA